jgi:hypothetical protein
VTVGAGAVALASLARADAPSDQYDFFNSNNDVIHDAQTGLYWQRYASSTTVTWDGAFTVCSSLSLDAYTMGWRVPSYKELLTIVDEVPHTEYEGGGLVSKALDSHAFPGAEVVTAAYWTSSTYPADSGSAYSVDFENGVPQQEVKSHLLYVRCVHD